MPPLPKRKHSTRRKGKRRAAIKLATPKLSPCPNCGKPRRSHQVCPHCGYYKGKQVVFKKVKEKKEKK